MEQTEAKVLKDTALALVGHLAAVDIVIRNLIETHAYPDVLQKSFQNSFTHAMATLLNSAVIPDLTISTAEEVLNAYGKAIQETVNANAIVQQEINALREKAKE